MTNRNNFDWRSIADAFGAFGKAGSGSSDNSFSTNLGKIIGAGAAIAAGLAVKATAENGGKFNFTVNGVKGVPLDELDLTDTKINKLIIAGPDRVLVKQGKATTVTVDGDDDARAAMRFALKDGALVVLSAAGWTKQGGSGPVTVRITLPRIKSLIAAGSGEVALDRLTGSKKGKAKLVVAGSGDVSIDAVTLEQLDIVIAGSGAATIVQGTAANASLTIAGSGSLDATELTVDQLRANIAGSGSAELASEGTVTGSIVGSGSLSIHGEAHCDVKQRGSGRLNQIRRARLVKDSKG